ncbi:MAG TPA: tetratricopeptide repeat protein [Polyangiaceae bacterium]
MQSQPLRRGGPAQVAEAFAFEAPLENEEAVLDAILAAMARGALPDGTWERLDAAALRDERTSELAFAFEGASNGKRLKTVSPAIAAEFLFQAGRFFGDVFGDEVAALTLLERSLAAAPSHAGAFGKVEELLTKMGALKKLAELHAAAAQHRPRAEQPPHLRHAADLLAQAGGSDDRVIELLQLALRLEPGDETTRAKLEAQCLKANRLRDVVRLHEQALVAEPPPDGPARSKLLVRLVELYADKLHEPERAMPHVESLLAIDPANDQGRKVAQKLVVIKGLAGRAAAALANAHEALGVPEDVGRYLLIELENTRGPKRAALLARLGRLRAERLGDEVGAFEALEQALAIDAGEDDLRATYAALARRLGRYADAAKTLGRVHGVAKSPAVKAMAAAQLGEMLLLGGDAKRAKAVLAPVLTAEEATPEAVLGAARTLSEIYRSDEDARGLVDVLERMALLEPEPARRQAADERLSVLAAELGDRVRAVLAYERLLSTSARAQALAALAPLYEAGGDPEKHARLLEEQAKDLADPQEARSRMMRAAEVRAKGTTGVEEAVATCRAIVDRFGPARDVHALLLPLLEAQRRWPDLSRALADEAALTSGTEHAQVMVRLGTLRVQRLSDGAGAIDAFTEALTFDPGDKTARLMLEKLAAHGDQRLAAARVLEPFYRRQNANGPLLKALELRGSLEPEIDDRLAALREAARLADAAEAGRATEVVGRALADAVAHGRPLAEWLDRLDGASVSGTDAKRRAAILGAAIGERDVTTEELEALAIRAAEAHSSAGEIPGAIALYQRALTFDPHSTELLSRIDDLLRDQGSPAERVALYRAALARGGSATKRKELLHRIGAIERHDLSDPAAAIATFRAALEDDAEDADAQVALGELYAQSARWTDLCDLLEARLARAEGDAARALRATLAGIAAEHGDHARARAQCEKLLEEADLSSEQLEAVARAADAMGNARLERGVLQRRVDGAEEPAEQIAWLDRLGELEEQRLSDPRAAAEAWKRAAVLAAAGGDDGEAQRLYGRAHEAAPDDRDVAWRLVELSERGGRWGALPALYAGLGDHAKDDAEKADLWLRSARVLADRLEDPAGAAVRASSALELEPSRADALATFEEISVKAGLVDAFVRAVDQALGRVDGDGSGEARARLLLSRARVLAAAPGRSDDGAAAYRGILEDGRVDEASRAAALAAFEALIAADPQSDPRRADRRWLLEWRAEHAPEAERPSRLLDWARQEETNFGDHARALSLFRRVLELDAESDEALSAAARLALAAGDVEGALAALRSRRGRADGAERVGIELEIAGVLLTRTSRRPEALEALRSVLAETPNDASARTLAMQLLEDEGTRADAVRMLDQTCDAADDAATRVEILSRLLDAPADAGLADARQRWFERLCDLHVEQGAHPAALDTAARAVRQMPDAPTLWDRADAAARSLSRPDDMAALYEEVLARPLTQEQTRVLGERAVKFCEEWFEDPSRVMRVLERVLALDPRADWAFDRLKLLLDAAERWDELFALYDRALAHADDRARVTLLEDAAQTAKDFADRPDRAILYLEALGPLKPNDAKLTNALERLYERQGRHRELVSLLTARLPSLEGEQAHKARARVASLWLEGLRDPAAAFEAIEPALDAAFPSTNGTAPQVWSLLEQILTASPPEARRSNAPPRRSSAPPESKRPRKSRPPSQAPPSVRQRVAGRLREHYAQTGDDAQLVRMLLVELEAVKASGERMRRHLQIADTHEKLGDAASALEHVGHAVVLDPKDEGKRTKLAALAEGTGRLQRFAELLSTAAGASEDVALRILLTMQAATVRADRTGDVAGAIALLTAVLATPELRDDDLLAAGRRLEALLEGAGRDEEQLDVLERVAGVEPDLAARRGLLGRAARLAERLGRQERAISLWEKRVAFAEDDREALDGLVGLLEQVGRRDRLADVLSLRARAASDDGARRADRVRVASLYSDALGRPGDAITAWRQIEDLFGPADDARLALASLFRQTCDWKELAALLERGASQATDARLRADLLRRLGDVQRQELGAAAAAVGTYGRALEADPRDEGARAGLLALADAPDLRAGAVVSLLGALRAADDWRAILDLAPRRLLAAASDPEKLAVLRETAQIHEHRAADMAMAFEAARSALVIAPADAGVEEEAVRLAESAQAWGRLIEAYREAIDGAAQGDGPLVARLRTSAGVALESRLGDAGGALEAYLQVVRDTADEGVGCAALRVAGRLGRWDVAAGVVVDVARAAGESSERLLEAYERAAQAAGGWTDATRALEVGVSSAGLASPASRDIEAQIAVWHRDHLADPEGAERATARALSHDPSSAALLTRLAELQRRHRGRSLVDTLLRLSSASGSDPALLREAAEVARESAGDVVLTRGILTELLELARARWSQGGEAACADHAEWAIESLARLYDDADDARALADVLTLGDSLPFSEAVRRGMRRRAARVALERLHDHERATSLYLALFDADPDDREAAERLAAIYVAGGRTRALLELRERQIAVASDVAVRMGLRLEASALLFELGERGRAADVLIEGLREDPRHDGAIEALARVFAESDRARDQIELLVDQAQRAQDAGDGSRAADLWGRAAGLAEERLGNTAAAEAHHARVAALEPRPASLDALGRLATARGDHAVAAQWLERLLEAADVDRREAATLRLADAWVAAGQPSRATERLARALLSAPGAQALRDKLATLYREQGSWPKLAELTADAAAHAPDKSARMARLCEAARLFADACGQPQLAVPLLEQAVDLAPGDQGASLALADALARSGRFDDARAMLRTMIDAFGARRPKERAPVHYQMARLELAMGNRARGLVELDMAARVDPQNPDILRALAELARDDGQHQRAEKSYRALLVVLRRREEAGEFHNVARSEVLLELSGIAERQGEADRAKEILESALEAAADGDFEQERLEAALRARGDFATLARVLEARLARLGDTPAAAKSLGELAEIYAERLDKVEEGLSARLRAVAMDPRSDAGHGAALALARAAGSVARYVAEVSALADGAEARGDAVLARSLLARVGAAAEHDLHDDGRAAGFYERSVALGLRDSNTLRALDGVFERLGDVAKRARALEMRIESETQVNGRKSATDAMYRLASIRLASRDTFDPGVDLMREALDLDPRLDVAGDALRAAVAIDAAHAGVLSLYEHIGRQPGHERILVDALRARAELPGADAETVREAVEIAVRLGERARAESLLERVVEREKGRGPGESPSRLAWALDALANVRTDLRSAVELKTAAARIAEPDVARRLTLEVARIAADHLEDLALAAEAYEGLRRADPADREAWEPLAAVYRRQGNAVKLAELLASVVDFVDDTALRARLRLERVRALESTGLSDAEAAPLLREIVDDDARQVEAALMLAGILERSGDIDALTDLLARQIDSAKDRDDSQSIVSLSLRLGSLVEASDRMQARNVYYAALEWKPQSADLLDALLRLLDDASDAGERADLLERRLALETGPAAEPMALALSADRAQLGDDAGAERALEVGYRAYPGSVRLRDRLEAALRARGDHAKLADLYILDAGARPSPAERVARLQEAAALRANDLQDFRGAAAALKLAREAAMALEEPAEASSALLRGHVEMLLEAGDLVGAIAELSGAIERFSHDDPNLGDLFAARADLRSRAGDDAGALQDFESAFAVGPAAHAGALAAQLDRMSDQAASRGDIAGLRTTRLRQAHVLPLAGDADGARAVLVDLLAHDPKDATALRALTDLEVGRERWDAASVALKRLVGLEEGDATVATALRLADVCERAGRSADARGALERARLLASGDRNVTRTLERLYEQTGAWAELAELVLQDAKASGDVADRFPLLLRVGALMLEKAGDPAAGVDALEEAHALRPGDPECVALLADAYALSGRHADAAAVLDQVLAPHKGRRVREMAPLYFRLAKAARHAENGAEEIRALFQALDCDGQNGAVCAEVGLRAMELDQIELASRALRAITLLKAPGPMSKALAYKYMGEIARKQGDGKRALMLLHRALTEDPSLEGARALVAVIEKGG